MAVRCPGCEMNVQKKGKPLKRHTNYSYYGVGRWIPEAVKAEVRRECGFGCVLHGTMIFIYDHFDPEFVDLKYRHESKGIALLCGDCDQQRKGTSPALTREMVGRYKQKPAAMKNGKAVYASFFLPPGPEFFKIGDLVLQGSELLLTVKDQPWLSIKQPDLKGDPVNVSASFKLETGETLLQLEKNELIAFPSSGFDYRQQSSSVVFLRNGEPFLELVRSDEKVMNIVRARSFFRGYFIELKDSGVFVNGELVLGGGDLQIHSDGVFKANLDKMYRSKFDKGH